MKLDIMTLIDIENELVEHEIGYYDSNRHRKWTCRAWNWILWL